MTVKNQERTPYRQTLEEYLAKDGSHRVALCFVLGAFLREGWDPEGAVTLALTVYQERPHERDTPKGHVQSYLSDAAREAARRACAPGRVLQTEEALVVQLIRLAMDPPLQTCPDYREEFLREYRRTWMAFAANALDALEPRSPDPALALMTPLAPAEELSDDGGEGC